ncbi:MAG: ATP-binding cassette domain-containing protein [Rhodobacter sp.]|nr:ATP-binding cassette domain-containing protein [Rhodobacter sp.]MCY4169371.1 ATP-binding cassette domain-containing protein [Rhodobacter sp.]MCY4243273.1 ATP-binding cassette domain-containing protein [Rhodobacter sp.]
MSVSLAVTGLVKRFGGLLATDDLSFRIDPGESVGLIGPNGAGKTTVFSQIMGEHRQTSGTIGLDGEEISGLSTSARIRRGVCRTYQVPRPFPDLTVAENVRVGQMPDSIWEMITRSGDRQREVELALSVGFAKGDLDRKPSELSMGNLRKLEMARTLATEPRLMLLDEVFAGLTAAEISVIAELVQSLRADGMTFLIVSHDLKALEPLIDRAIAIDRGAKVAEGPYLDVIKNPRVRASYLGTS